MASSVICQCPNCGAGLVFNPGKGRIACNYCGADFAESDLQACRPAEAPTAEAQPAPGPAKIQGDDGRQAVTLSCPACGGEVMADEATAATSCVYCRNPVILSGRLSGAWKPDKVIPFAFDEAEAKQRIMDWAKGRRFIDGGFLAQAKAEKPTGVYFPFWVASGNAQGEMRAMGQNIRVWRVGRTEYTEVSRFALSREGDFTYGNLALKATGKDAARMLDGIYPYDPSRMLDFSMPYLSGFLAEKRTREKTEVEPEADDLLRRSGWSLLRGTMSGYDSVAEEHFSLSVRNSSWRYVLMPVWLLTYTYGGKNWYFAVNGQTGKVAGKVPVGRGKLGLLFCATWALAGVAAMVVLRGLL